MTTANELCKAIAAELAGIDQDEVDSDRGWWETSSGVEFGVGRLAAVMDAVRSAMAGPPGSGAMTGNLAHPYGEGNHHRISWRRAWDVDREALTATHMPTGFVLAFTPCPDGGYTARPGCELPPFGPDGTLAMAQMFGLRELLKDGWEIFHTVMAKNTQ